MDQHGVIPSMANVTWRSAASYPDAPHEYVLRERYPEAYAFYQERITQEGVDEPFTIRGRTARYRYYYAGDNYKYWIIGDVLNRAAAAQPAASGRRNHSMEFNSARNIEMTSSSENDIADFFSHLSITHAAELKAQRHRDLHLAPRLNVVRDYIRPSENQISNIFRDLLSPDGAHGQGSIFLSEFLREIGISDRNADCAIVREAYTDAGRKIDLLLTFSDRKVIGIENKLEADDQIKQVEDYCEYLQRKYIDYVFYYLTPRPAQPSLKSISEATRMQLMRARKLQCISYQREITSWLNACVNKCKAEKVIWFLRDLRDFITQQVVHVEGSSSE